MDNFYRTHCEPADLEKSSDGEFQFDLKGKAWGKGSHCGNRECPDYALESTAPSVPVALSVDSWVTTYPSV